MSAVRSQRLGANAALGTSLTQLYAVPAGKRTIVKSIIVQNQGAAAAHLTCYVRTGSTVLCSFAIFTAAAGSSGETVLLDCWFVLDDGDNLAANASAGTYRVLVSGAELLT